MERLCYWRGKAVGCPPICWRSHESLLSRFASEQEAALAMAEHSKRSSGKATTPFELHVLFLSELACFSAQTLRRPQVYPADRRFTARFRSKFRNF